MKKLKLKALKKTSVVKVGTCDSKPAKVLFNN